MLDVIFLITSSLFNKVEVVEYCIQQPLLFIYQKCSLYNKYLKC